MFYEKGLHINKMTTVFGIACVFQLPTVVENHRKSRIQHCERSELRLHFEWAKVHGKMPKMVNFGDYLKTLSLLSNSVTRQVIYIRLKSQNAKVQNATF